MQHRNSQERYTKRIDENERYRLQANRRSEHYVPVYDCADDLDRRLDEENQVHMSHTRMDDSFVADRCSSRLDFLRIPSNDSRHNETR